MNIEHIAHFRMSFKNDRNMLELWSESTINVFREEYTHQDILQYLSKVILNGNSSCQESLHKCGRLTMVSYRWKSTWSWGKLYLKAIKFSFCLRVVVIMYFIIWRCSATDIPRTHCILRKPFLRSIFWYNNHVHLGKSRMSSSETVAFLQRVCNLEQRASFRLWYNCHGSVLSKTFPLKGSKILSLHENV